MSGSCPAAGKEPWLGLIMAGVIPASVALTVWQLSTQKDVRLKLMRTREEMDGTVVEQLGGLEYVRAANTQQLEVKRVARSAEKRRSREIRHHFEMSLFGCAKALNEGLFHILVLGLAIYLALHGRIELLKRELIHRLQGRDEREISVVDVDALSAILAGRLPDLKRLEGDLESDEPD